MNHGASGAAAVGVCLLLGAGPAGPAGAQPSDDPEGPGLSLEVEGGIEGWSMPGREFPVRVTIETDRLVRGTLRVHAPGLPGATLVEREVEVSGGSTARIDLVMPAWPADGIGDDSRAELVVDGDVVARDSFELHSDPGEELVGLLPDAVAAEGGAGALPGSVPLAADLGVARPVALDPDLLALGGLALEPLDQLVSGPAELAALPADHRAAITAWVQAGGQLLLVGDDLDATGDVLPEGWSPPPGAGVRAGLGQVRAVGDDWAAGLLPSPTRSSWEEELIASDLYSSMAPVEAALADAVDLHLPDGRGLGLLLAAYVVLAGPVVFSVARRSQRRQLAWVAIPLLAVGSTGVVFTTGSSLRRSLGSAQVTVYETGPAGTVATTWSLLSNRHGGEIGVELPEGWVAGEALQDEMTMDLGRDGAAPLRLVAGAGDAGAGAEALVETAVAGYASVQARGPVPGMDAALEVTASSDADGVVRGTVRNTLDVALDEVAVFFGRMGVADLGTLAAGEERDFALEAATAFAWSDWSEPKVWPEPGMDGDVGFRMVVEPPPVDEVAEAVESRVVVVPGPAPPPPLPVAPEPGVDFPVPEVPGGAGADGVDADDESPLVLGAWAAVQRRVGWNFRPIGQVVAVGWTDELDAPVTPSSGAGPSRSSRSAVVARATVTPAGERLTDAAVVRSLVRGPVTETRAPDEVGGAWAFFLPATVDGRPVDTRRLVVNQASSFNRAEFWTPGGWVAADIPATGQAEVAVPPSAVIGGVVVYRWAVPNAVPEGRGRDLTIYEKEAPR